MNNKLLLTLVFSIIFGLATTAQEYKSLKVSNQTISTKITPSLKTNEYNIINCGEDIYGLGGLDRNISLKIMNKVSAASASLLKGNKITKIIFGLGREKDYDITGISNIKVFITEDPEGSYIVSQTSSSTTSGWHEVVLDTPYDISDKEFYIGYEADLTAYRYGIGISDGDYELTSFYYDGKKQTWLPDWGIASVYAVASGDIVPEKSNLAVKSPSVLPYIKSGEEVKVNFVLNNKGFDEITSVDITYGFTGETKTEPLEVNLKPGESINANCTIDANIATGVEEKTIEITVTPTGKEDIDMSDNHVSTSTFVYAEDAILDGQKKVLFEQFTTEKCPNCPNGDENVNKALAKYTNGEVIRMSHHSGYYEDKLTLEYTEKICYYFFNSNSSYAPSCMIDRKYREGYPGYGNSNAPGPIFGISVSMIQKAIDEDLSNPLFATVNLDTEYNKDTRTLDIKVNGKCLLNLKNLRLNIIMTEDGINGYQAGAGATWTHYHATRDALTDDTGVSITLDDDGNYSYQTTYKIPTSISGVLNQSVAVNSEKINIIAFLCEMPLDNPLLCEVLNAEIAEKPASTTSIKDINGENFSIYVENGYLVVDGEFDNAQLFDINGSLVKNINEKVSSVSDLNNGIYLVKVFANGNSGVSKVLINR